MQQVNKLSTEIDKKNNVFTSAVKKKLKDLSLFSDHALEWLMMEHYQFSAKNTKFLWQSVEVTQRLKEEGVSDELERNFLEEKNHAAIYKKALMEIGTDVEKRLEFTPTTNFFSNIARLIETCPSTTLGTMYATETAAIFEHEVFWEISREVITQRKYQWENSRLKKFHDMHLSGVEQGHKDGLGLFVDLANDNQEETAINQTKVLSGANAAIHAMTEWWDALLNRAQNLK